MGGGDVCGDWVYGCGEGGVGVGYSPHSTLPLLLLPLLVVTILITIVIVVVVVVVIVVVFVVKLRSCCCRNDSRSSWCRFLKH